MHTETDKEYTEKLIAFIEKSPTGFHAVKNISDMLISDGFQKLDEKRRWKIERGKSYFVTRNSSAMIAFRIPEEKPQSFSIIASHTDSPSFRVKTNPEISASSLYTTLNTEGYGGALIAPWFDRPLSIAGRAYVRNGNGYEERLVDFQRPFVMLPSLAIHMDRKVNEGHAYSVQKEIAPLFAEGFENARFRKALAENIETAEDDLLEYDLFLYPKEKGAIWGLDGEFFSSPRIDDLMCAFTSIDGLVKAGYGSTIAIAALFDNEEVGSGTKQGAAAPTLRTILERVVFNQGGKPEDLYRAIHNSFMISADTDGDSAAVFKTICRMADVPFQTFVNHSDMAGGSTLGNILLTQMEMRGVDIGNPMWAMHSVRETAGVQDQAYVIKAFTTFYNI